MIEEALALGPVAGPRWFSERIAQKHTGNALVEGPAYSFDPFGFAAGGRCTVTVNADEYLQTATMLGRPASASTVQRSAPSTSPGKASR